MPRLRFEIAVHTEQATRVWRWEYEAVLEQMQSRLNNAPVMMPKNEQLNIPSGRSSHGWAQRIS